MPTGVIAGTLEGYATWLIYFRLSPSEHVGPLYPGLLLETSLRKPLSITQAPPEHIFLSWNQHLAGSPCVAECQVI